MDSVAPRVKVGHHAESGRRPAGPPKLGNVPPLNFKRGVNYALCLQLLCPNFLSYFQRTETIILFHRYMKLRYSYPQKPPVI